MLPCRAPAKKLPYCLPPSHRIKMSATHVELIAIPMVKMMRPGRSRWFCIMDGKCRRRLSWFRTSEWGVSRHRNSVLQVFGMADGSQAATSRNVALSSLLFSLVSRSPTSPAPMASRRAGSAGSWPATGPTVRRRSSRCYGAGRHRRHRPVRAGRVTCMALRSALARATRRSHLRCNLERGPDQSRGQCRICGA
jgi:hypothetical protein